MHSLWPCAPAAATHQPGTPHQSVWHLTPHLARTLARTLLVLDLSRTHSVWYKFRDASFYPAWTHAIASVVAQIPAQMLDVALWSIITYFMIGFYTEPVREAPQAPAWALQRRRCVAAGAPEPPRGRCGRQHLRCSCAPVCWGPRNCISRLRRCLPCSAWIRDACRDVPCCRAMPCCAVPPGVLFHVLRCAAQHVHQLQRAVPVRGPGWPAGPGRARPGGPQAHEHTPVARFSLMQMQMHVCGRPMERGARDRAAQVFARCASA